jgi:signal transduction histidine kinase
VVGFFEYRIVLLRRARKAQEEFSFRLIESQEAERKRIAAELHDGLGQELLLIKNRLQMINAESEQPVMIRNQVEEISKTTSRAIADMRAISAALRPSALEHIGLTKAIEWMVEQVETTSKMKVEKSLENIDGLLRAEQEIHLFRIVQEGLNNVIKHSSASEATLEIARQAQGIEMSLFDNGRGFDVKQISPSPGGAGLGLTGLAERARVLGGTLDILSAPGRGTRLTVLIPLSPEK